MGLIDIRSVRAFLVIICGLLLFSACVTEPSEPIEPEEIPTITVPDEPVEIPVSAEPLPPDMFRDHKTYFEAMGEGSLREAANTGEFAFRFLWLRDFHIPFMVRGFVEDDNKMKLYLAKLDNAGDLDEDRFVYLTELQTSSFLSKLQALNICGSEPEVRKTGNGSTWAFELAESGNYCRYTIQSPSDGGHEGQYKSFGLDLLKTAGIKTWEMQVY